MNRPATRESTGERRALRAAREPGPLYLTPEVRDALIRILTLEASPQSAIDPSPILSLEAVDTLEEYLRARMPDDALAIYAARTPALAVFDLAKIGTLSEQAWGEGLSKARIVLGTWGKVLVCIPRRPEKGYPLRVTFFDPDDHTEANPSTLAEWLNRVFENILEQRVQNIDDDDLFFGEEEQAGEGLAWYPRLERTLVMPVARDEKAGRRVRHARFGEGVIRRSLSEGDKLEIDFGDVGVKVLVAKYVTELDGDA